MGARVSRTNFEWVGSDEPHATRRRLILAKYPQIKQLMGADPNFKWVVSALVLFQCASLVPLSYVQSLWKLCLVGYCLTGVINHALMLAVHEISHGQAFGAAHGTRNKLFGLFANLPLGVPMSISFKKYHLDHHRYQGDEVLDTDIPSSLETKLFANTFTKLIWLALQPFFYAFRPFFVHPKAPTVWEGFNFAAQIVFDLLVWQLFGFRMLGYLLCSTLVVMGVHPCAGHFVSEHYLIDAEESSDLDASDRSPDQMRRISSPRDPLLRPDTSSYYGPLNYVTFNVGYHVEHHDFPSIPGSRLPFVRKIAPEFYEALPSHSSWAYVLYRYVVDPAVGPFARVKRKTRLTVANPTTEPIEVNDDQVGSTLTDCDQGDPSVSLNNNVDLFALKSRCKAD
jgi:sphingolipid delta-4 desaturase